jgi:mannose-6-phosphate isomerase-like protein (cupin superfamily)
MSKEMNRSGFALNLHPDWLCRFILPFRPSAGLRNTVMKETVKCFDPELEYYTKERCFIAELSNTPDDPAVSIARARVAPGVTTRRHRVRETAERYVILEGRGRVEIGSLPPQEVGPGDVVLIPPSCPQRIANTGAGDLIFLAVCSPRFTNEAYEDIDDEPDSGGTAALSPDVSPA